MADTYTQLSIQLVFAVKNRNGLITSDFRERLHQYITGIIQNKKNKLLVINSVTDHIHIFMGLHPTNNISDLVRDIKSDSSTFINENKLSRFPFHWQEGFGAFSYSHSHRDSVIKYILNQEKHHKKQTFKEEYFDFLKKFEIEYNEKYVFDWLE